MANKDQIEKMCVSHLGSYDKTDPADVSETTNRHNYNEIKVQLTWLLCLTNFHCHYFTTIPSGEFY